MPKFYLSTPIYYVNAAPHIGHAYTTIVADTIKRIRRMLGDDAYLVTGSDEHGQKVERAAAAAGLEPLQFTDRVSAAFPAGVGAAGPSRWTSSGAPATPATPWPFARCSGAA